MMPQRRRIWCRKGFAGHELAALLGRTRTLTSGYQALVSALNRLPTRPSTLLQATSASSVVPVIQQLLNPA
jgi:hypothetical protein